MSRQNELAKNTAILTIGKLSTHIVTFFLLPLYTSLLSTEEFGAYDLLVTYGTLLLPLVNWQLDQGLFRFMLDCRGQKEKQTELFSTLLTACALQSGLYALIFLIIYPYLTIENADFLLLYIILHVFNAMLLQFVRGLGSSAKYAFATFISAVATTLFNVISLVFLKMGLTGLYVSTLTAQVLTMVYLVYASTCWKFFSVRKLRYTVFKTICGYSTPLIPNNLAWWVVNASDRMIIAHYLGLAANGIYTIANKFPNLFIQFYNILNLSWTETVSLHFNDEDRDVFLSETITAVFKMFAGICLLMIAVMPFVFPYMVNEQFTESYNHIYILLTGMIFRVLVGLYSCVYVAQKQVKKIATTSMVAATINLSLDLILVHIIDIYAASISTLIAFVAMFVVRYIDINRQINMKIQANVVVPVIIFFLINGVTYYSNNLAGQTVVLIATILFVIIRNRDMMIACIHLVKRKLFSGR